MGESEQAAPTFTYFLGVEPVPGEAKVTVVFGDDNGRGYKLGIDAKILAPLITELSARLQAIQSPVGDDFVTSALRAQSAKLAVWKEGPAVLLNIGAYALAVDLSRASLSELYRELGTYLSQQ